MEQVGAELSFMEDAWWGPTIMLPRGPWFTLAERSLPCSFMVNPRGERFMNESLPYVEAGHRMYGGEYGQGEGPAENLPAWIIFDQEYKNRYLFAGLQAKQPLPRKWLATENFHKADTLAELAELIGVPADALERTGSRLPVQGNLDPALLFAPWEVVEREVRRILDEGRAAPGHIFNLGHGVLPDTDPVVLTRVVELVHEVSSR